MKRYIYLLLAIILPTITVAQRIRVAAPRQVVVGEEFQVEYTVYTDNIDGFKLAKIPDGIEILAGPYIGKQSSYQVINGHTSSSSSITYDYVFVATKKGNFTLPPAKITINGQNLASTPVKLSAFGNANINRSANGRGQYADEIEVTRPESKTVGSKDLFIKVSANKTKVYEQEPIVLTYKVYTSVNLISLAGKMPDLTGFHIQEVKLPQQKSFHTEIVNGRKYQCTTWSQYVLFPLVPGKTKIPSITFHGTIRPGFDDFDPFAFMSDGGDINKDIIAPGLTLKIIPLPQKPIGFSGGVGKLNITAQLNNDEVKEGDPINLRVIISGQGNLKLLKQPIVGFPKDFDVYDAKVSDKTTLGVNGTEGSIVYDFMAVPHKKGVYEIPAIKYIYFDTSSNSYKTIQTRAFKIKVAKGNGIFDDLSAITKNNWSDIRTIKTGRTKNIFSYSFFGSVFFWLTLFFIVISFVVMLQWLKKRSHMQADIVFLKGKNARKVAIVRMHNARQLMERGKSTEFYDEVLHALWGYVSNKLDIPVERLSRNNIRETFSQKNVGEQTINKFIEALDECEFQRYAPGDERGNMKSTYESALSAITDIEETMKKKTKDVHSNILLWMFFIQFFICILWSSNAFSQKKTDADKAYQSGNYEQAIHIYQSLLSKEATADLFYNLGNAYYKHNDITKSIIAYERALRLSPSDEDILFNLNLAQSKTIDRIPPKPEMFFVSWTKALINLLSIDGWAYLGLISLFFALALTLVYLFESKLKWKKIGFFLAVSCFLLFIFSNVFALYQRSELLNNDSAIVISPMAEVKLTPSNKSASLMIIHEGTRVNITDRNIRDWRGITLANGDSGWIKSDMIEEI
nr:BatD family protein [uncultured Prevotella sp.]